VTLRQYRPGTDSICLEIPGGMIDEGEQPMVAAARELEEETGYVAGRWSLLGRCSPNPALQNNSLHSYLALDATATGIAAPEDGEVLSVTTIPMATMVAMIRQGEVEHALVLAAFAHLALAQPELLRSL
jgi:ADP-ribose pyrophosphatase